MKKVVKATSLIAVIGICFVAGLYGGPLVRGIYARLFPPPAYTTGDFSSLYKAAGEPVVLFSTSTCPFCKETRALFAEKRVAYADYIVDKSKGAESGFKKLDGSAVPMIFIGNRRIVGFNKPIIESSLAQIGSHAGTNRTIDATTR